MRASEASEKKNILTSYLFVLYSRFVPLILRIFSCRTQNSAYAYHLHFCWRTAYQGSAYRIPSKKVEIRRTEKGGYSLHLGYDALIVMFQYENNSYEFFDECRGLILSGIKVSEVVYKVLKY